MLEDRNDGGKKLAKALERYKDKKVLVLAIPRGGVEVGFHITKYLNADFSLLISRKLPFPDNSEAGIGALAEDGIPFIFEDAAGWLSEGVIDRIKKEQIEEIKRRIQILRERKPLPEIKGRTVIFIDDGLAMGSTMRASIMLCKKEKGREDCSGGSCFWEQSCS